MHASLSLSARVRRSGAGGAPSYDRRAPAEGWSSLLSRLPRRWRTGPGATAPQGTGPGATAPQRRQRGRRQAEIERGCEPFARGQVDSDRRLIARLQLRGLVGATRRKGTATYTEARSRDGHARTAQSRLSVLAHIDNARVPVGTALAPIFMVSIDDVAVARTAARHRLEAARRVLSRPKCGEAGQQALGLEAATPASRPWHCSSKVASSCSSDVKPSGSNGSGSPARDAFSSRQRRSDHANQVCPRRRRIVWARSFDSPHRIAHS